MKTLFALLAIVAAVAIFWNLHPLPQDDLPTNLADWRKEVKDQRDQRTGCDDLYRDAMIADDVKHATDAELMFEDATKKLVKLLKHKPGNIPLTDEEARVLQKCSENLAGMRQEEADQARDDRKRLDDEQREEIADTAGVPSPAPDVAATPSEPLYLLWVNGHNAGPATVAQIRAALAAGQIKRETPLVRTNSANWQTVKDLGL